MCFSAFADIFFRLPLHAAEEKNKLKKTIVPVLMYSGDSGFGSGAYVMLRRRFKETQKNDKYSIAGIFTTEKQVISFISISKYITDSFKLNTKASYRDRPSSIYLPGHNTKFEDHADYNLQEFGFSLNPALEKGIFEFGPVISYSDINISDREEEMEYIFDNIDGAEDYSLFGYGASFSADTRDNDTYPLTGYFWDTEFLNYDKSLSGDYSFRILKSDFRYFFNIKSIIFASQIYSKLSWGDTPVHKMPSMGSQDLMRGISAKRYKDKDMVLLQSEIRYPLMGRFSGTFFAGIGNVASTLSRLQLSSHKAAYGIGFRYAVSPDDRLNLRLDIGSNNRISSSSDDDSFNIYFSIGEAF